MHMQIGIFVKRIFDPDDIFNPGKKVDASFSYAMAHLKGRTKKA